MGYGYNIEIPAKMIEEKSDFVKELMHDCMEHTWGRNASIYSDGMDSMNKLFRESFFNCQLSLGAGNSSTYYELDDYYSKIQSKVMEYVDDDDKKNNIFPGFQEKNHVQGNSPSPLKDDWTKVCPHNLSTKDRQEKCMSIQETIWGTENMERLEKIKKSIDPNSMFQVYIGIGQKDVSPQQEYKWPTQVPENYKPIQVTTDPVSIAFESGNDHVGYRIKEIVADYADGN